MTSPDCHLCHDAITVLGGLEDQGRVALEVCAHDSLLGMRLVAEHRPALFPLVLVDDEFLSTGRLSRGRLRKALDRRAVRERRR